MGFSSIPLPKVVGDVGPGGGIVTGLNALNDLRTKQLTNKYYGPNMEANINNTNALTQGQNITNQYLPDKLQLANQYQGLINQFYGPNIQSEMANRNALTNKYNTMTPLEAEQMHISNQFAPATAQANIDFKRLGGSGMGTGGKEELFFQNLVHRDNPQLTTPEQIYEASNALRQGRDTLSDGTKLNPLSPASRDSFNRITKYGTTSPIITGNLKGAQAEAELPILSKYAQEGLKPFGTTYFNKSPAQVVASFKSDPESQKQLGRFIAAKQLQFEIAQNEIKLANGQPGVTTTQELMDLGQQNIYSVYPKLSFEAREEAQRYFLEALKKAFNARQAIPIGASQSQGDQANNKRVTKKWILDPNGNLVESQ